MANTSMNVSLPESLKAYVLERVAEGTFSNPSDYVRALIREDRRRRAEDRLEALLLEGIESGPAEPFPEGFWEDLRHKIRDHAATAAAAGDGEGQRKRGADPAAA